MAEATWLDAELEEDDEGAGAYERSADPIDEAVAGEGYIANYVLDDCVETFDGGFYREPERFDRFYYKPQTEPPYVGPAPILIDVLQADDDVTRAAEAERKHVEFKRRWCAEHDLRYTVLVADDAVHKQAVLRMLGEQLPREASEPAPEPAEPKPARRSAVQRPGEDG